MTDFLEGIVRLGSVAVVGMAKNSGKTVTINYLIALATEGGVALGLTSTGRDGETADVLTSLPKPAVWLPEGSVLATAKGSLGRGSARLELLATTGIFNPLGEIVLARVREQGTVEVSGPEQNIELGQIIALMQKFVPLVLVDGALDRRASSAPAVTAGTILATGAVLGPDIKSVVLPTVHTARLLSLPGFTGSNLARETVLKGLTALENQRGEVQLLPLVTAVDAPIELLDWLGPDSQRLLLGGAFTEELAELLLSASRVLAGLEIVVRDGTRIFVTARTWQMLQRLGASISVIEPINLLAVTVNPVDPRGRQLPGEELVKSLQHLLPNVRVFNPLAEEVG